MIRKRATTQSSGKEQVIGDAADGGQPETAGETNKLRLCSASQPTRHLTTLRREPTRQGKLLPKDELIHTGAEDWPDTCKLTPMDPADAGACVVTYGTDRGRSQPFRSAKACLGAVGSHGTQSISQFCEAVVERYLAVMYTMHFNDATLQDWGSLGDAGRTTMRQLMTIRGKPFAEAKQQDMGPWGHFPGPRSRCITSNLMWGSPCLGAQAVGGQADRHVHRGTGSDSFGSGAAAELCGTADCSEGSTFEKVGQLGPNAVKEGQHSREKIIAEDLDRSFSVTKTVVKPRPEGVVHLSPPVVEKYVEASDAAYEDNVGSGRFLLTMLDNHGSYRGGEWFRSNSTHTACGSHARRTSHSWSSLWF